MNKKQKAINPLPVEQFVMRKINNLKHTVRIEKLSRTTRLEDLNPKAWDFIGITVDDFIKRPYLLVKDIPFEIWRCSIGQRYNWHYGKTIREAIENALLSYT